MGPERPSGRGSFRLVVNELYGEYCNEAERETEASFSFDDAAIRRALKNIYNKNFNPTSDIEESLFFEFWSGLNTASDIGFAQSSDTSDYDLDLRNAIKYNNGVFAAFKTHRLQNDVAAQLLDSNGKIKPFEQWLNDVRPIADHQVYNWFKTEYNTAIKRAKQAVDWQKYIREEEWLPNLEWLPTTSQEPRELHIQFYGLVLPVRHWFWSKHRPKDEWGCNCGLSQTTKPRTPEGDIPINDEKPSAGLDNIPNDGELFSKRHPYFEHAYKGAKDNILPFMQNQVTARLKQLRQVAKPLTEQVFSNPALDRELKISNKGIKEWLNQPHAQQFIKNELLLDLDSVIEDATYRGYGIDKHDSTIKTHILETEIMNSKSWIIVREFEDGRAQIYSITDRENILNIIK